MGGYLPTGTSFISVPPRLFLFCHVCAVSCVLCIVYRICGCTLSRVPASSTIHNMNVHFQSSWRRQSIDTFVEDRHAYSSLLSFSFFILFFHSILSSDAFSTSPPQEPGLRIYPFSFCPVPGWSLHASPPTVKICHSFSNHMFHVPGGRTRLSQTTRLWRHRVAVLDRMTW